ncbi:MAG: aminotransferase class III-fold pyridoxal phosphate-dependent enzyme [Thermaerobacter sp.]|nr:aminotransferase class III-fold pyridoxal phosphate-dependent enzyme [Thermaerobacter sp.]
MPNSHYLMEVYRRYPVTLVSGEGDRLYDSDGRRYWDFLSGIGVNSLGYNHPLVRQALADSASLLHASNLFWHEPGRELSRRMAGITGGFLSFWGNSGAEANEGAMKLVRRAGGGRTAILSLTGAFHGRTLGALSLTPTPAYQTPFAPLVPDCHTIAFGDLKSLDEALERLRPAAVFFEAIQGEGGVVVPPAGYLRDATRKVHDAGALVVMDEVQTGMGRTGDWFAFDAEGVSPDVITVAKGLGAGVPIGGVLARPEVGEQFQPGDHGTTFGGNLLASRMALAVTGWLAEGGLDAVRAKSQELDDALRGVAERWPGVVHEVRGRGLMRGLVINGSAPEVVMAALRQGVILNAPKPDVIRFLPPLVVSSEAIGEMANVLDKILAEIPVN